LRVVTGLIAVMALACGGASPTNPGAGTPPVPLSGVATAGDWITSTPEAEGFNASLLAELNGRLRAGADGAIDSLLIARRGKLVAEEYYQGMAAETVHTIRCDWARFMLDWRMREAPGSRWEYVRRRLHRPAIGE
jgi:hypothetical protein